MINDPIDNPVAKTTVGLNQLVGCKKNLHHECQQNGLLRLLKKSALGLSGGKTQHAWSMFDLLDLENV